MGFANHLWSELTDAKFSQRITKERLFISSSYQGL